MQRLIKRTELGGIPENRNHCGHADIASENETEADHVVWNNRPQGLPAEYELGFV